MPRKSLTPAKQPPIHPGEHLREILEDAGLSANAAASAMKIPTNRLTAIINGQRSITGDTAIRLGRFFGNSPQFWMNLQANYDVDRAQFENGDRVQREVQPHKPGPITAARRSTSSLTA
jgi:addiction module HigA family antidote